MARRGAAPPRPIFRASTDFRVRFVAVRFIALVVAFPTLALPVVVFDLRVRDVVAFTAFALAVDGAAFAAALLLTREAGRLSTFGDV